MQAVVTEGGHVWNASEGGKGLFALVEESFEVGGAKFGKEEPECCFDGKLENLDLSEPHTLK